MSMDILYSFPVINSEHQITVTRRRGLKERSIGGFQ